MVKWSATSMAIRPVTHTALVEVNRASIKLTLASSRTETGRSSKRVPSRITRAKPTAMSLPGGCFLIKSEICLMVSYAKGGARPPKDLLSRKGPVSAVFHNDGLGHVGDVLASVGALL